MQIHKTISFQKPLILSVTVNLRCKYTYPLNVACAYRYISSLECQNGHCIRSNRRNLPRDVVHLPCGHLVCVDCLRSMFLLLPTLGPVKANGLPNHCRRPIPLHLVDELLHDDEKKTYNDWVREQ